MRLINADEMMLKIDMHGTNKFGMLDEDIRQFINDAPTIDAEPVKHGMWLPHKILASSKCSLCRRAFAGETPYCPNCGAKMDLKEGESE